MSIADNTALVADALTKVRLEFLGRVASVVGRDHCQAITWQATLLVSSPMFQEQMVSGGLLQMEQMEHSLQRQVLLFR